MEGQYAKAEQQAAKVEVAITKAIEAGKRDVSIEGAFENSVLAKLRQMGYAVSYNSDQREGSYTSITW